MIAEHVNKVLISERASLMNEMISAKENLDRYRKEVNNYQSLMDDLVQKVLDIDESIKKLHEGN